MLLVYVPMLPLHAPTLCSHYTYPPTLCSCSMLLLCCPILLPPYGIISSSPTLCSYFILLLYDRTVSVGARAQGILLPYARMLLLCAVIICSYAIPLSYAPTHAPTLSSTPRPHACYTASYCTVHAPTVSCYTLATRCPVLT
eukprot:3320924-Rhodomonas_salina.1